MVRMRMHAMVLNWAPKSQLGVHYVASHLVLTTTKSNKSNENLLYFDLLYSTLVMGLRLFCNLKRRSL